MCFQGNQAKDSEGIATGFGELSTSASLMSASKLLGAVAMLPGCAPHPCGNPQHWLRRRVWPEEAGNDAWAFRAPGTVVVALPSHVANAHADFVSLSGFKSQFTFSDDVS